MSTNMSDAIRNLLTRAKNRAEQANPEELVYLAKAIQAVAPGEGANFIMQAAEMKAAEIEAAGTAGTTAITAESSAKVTAVTDAGNAKLAEVNALATSTFKTVGGESILGSGDIQSGKFLGMAYKHFTGRERSTGRLTGLTLNYIKKSSTSRLILQSFIFGEISGHNCRLRVWNSVDGYWSENGYQTCALKVDEGGYTGGDVSSTPGTASHTAVTSTIAADTNVEFRWYVSSETFQLGGSYNTSGANWEHAASWMVVTEVEE